MGAFVVVWDEYTRRVEERRTRLKVLEGSAGRIATARLLVALLAVGLVVAMVWAGLPPSTWFAVLGLLAVFVALVVAHARVFEQRSRAEAVVHFYERGLARRSDAWRTSPLDGATFRTGDHPYVDDLDVFGKGSLFQLIDTTETRHGGEHLARLLRGEDLGPFPEGVLGRQEAVRDIATRLDFREGLAASGHKLRKRRPDPQAFLAWAEEARALRATPLLRFASYALPIAVVLLLGVGPALGWPRSFALPFIAVELLLLGALGPRLRRTLTVVSQEELAFASYGEMLGLVENEALTAPLLTAAKARLAATGHRATQEMAALARIVSFLEARNNEVFRIFIAPLLLWDLHCGLALEAWRDRVGRAVRGWLEVLGEVEALSSLAALAAERPGYAFAELASEPCFEAEGLGHPLIPEERRVVNDVALSGAGHVLVVTGSNMSGKSTLLRAMGLAAVMALAGAPTCARRLRVGPLRVATSMRIRDNLEAGVSHFYAEVSALKRVLDLTRTPPPVFFLLDEILHGTNSRERLIGARTVVAELVRRGALGAVSTHDLGLSDLQERLEGRARNVHFEEQVEGDRMTFDYRLRQGVVTSSNALRLMRMVGIDVPLDGPAEARPSSVDGPAGDGPAVDAPAVDAPAGGVAP